MRDEGDVMYVDQDMNANNHLGETIAESHPLCVWCDHDRAEHRLGMCLAIVGFDNPAATSPICDCTGFQGSEPGSIRETAAR